MSSRSLGVRETLREMTLDGASQLGRAAALSWAVPAAIALTLAWTQAEAQTKTRTIAEADTRTVTAGVPRHWPPQYDVDEAGRPVGFAIDVMEAIAARAHLEVRYRVYDTFAAVVGGLDDGEIDLMPNSGILPERLDRYAFTSPVETFAVSIFVRDDTLGVEVPEDLSGQKVGVVERNVGIRLVKGWPELTPVIYGDVRGALFSLIAGEVEALIYPEPVLLRLARAAGIEDDIKTVGEPLLEVRRGIRVRKEDTALLQILDQAVDDFVPTPAYQAIYVKWYGKAMPFWSPARLLMMGGGLAALLVVAMVWWRYRSVVKLNRRLGDTIAEREHAHLALRDSEQRFETIADALPVLIAHLDMGFRYRFANRTHVDWHGVAVERVVGNHIRDVIGETMYETIRPSLETALSGQAVITEAEVTYRLAGRRFVQATYIPEFDTAGDVRGLYAHVVDITEQKQAEARLRLREQELSEAQRIGHIGHWRLRIAENRLEASEELYRIYGLDPEGGLDFGVITDAFHEDDRDEMRRSRENAIAEKRGYDFGLRIRRPDGEIRFIEGRTEPILDAGESEIVGFFGITQDVTERKLAEAASQRVVDAIENLSEGFALFDADDRLVACNRQYKRVSAADIDLLVPGTTFAEILRDSLKNHPYTEAEGVSEASLAARMERHRNPYGTFEVIRDGRRLSVREERLSDGGTVIAALDITEQRQREDQLRQSQKMEAIGQLTGGIAHDFNNLLAIVQGNIAFLERKLEPDSQLRALTSPALRAAKRGASLTQRLLAFSRRQTLDVTAVDAGELVHGLAEMLERSLGEDIRVEIAVEPELWSCRVDAGQVEQAIINLANNARDAMPEGGTLNIGLRNAHLTEARLAEPDEVTAGDYVAVSVTDSGSGMPVEVRAQIFDPFFTTKDVGKGTGLGLSMVYGFAKQSGGHVTVDSSEGMGTTIELLLPRAGAEPADENDAAKAKAPATPKETVLVVEDDDDLRSLAVLLLNDFGYRVLEASGASQALRLMGSENRVDLLLTDVVLTDGMGGRELANAARAQHESLKVLFMSGYPRSEVAGEGGLGPGVRILAKPFDPEDLAEAVRTAIDA